MDDWRDVAIWEDLAGNPALAGLVARAGEADAGSPAEVARLRREAGGGARAAALVAAALELAEARRKAARKFEGAERLWCDVAGVEQASGTLVARWKARRIREALGGDARILDLCAGIGGDAIEFVRAGLAVEAVDLEPRRVFMATRNAGCAGRVADVEALDPAGLVLHVDPARRDERGSRRWSLDGHRPGRAWIERALATSGAAAIKFGPGVDRTALASASTTREPEWEFVEERGTLVQAVAWTGALAGAPGLARATILGSDAARTIAGTPMRPDPAAADLGNARFVCEPSAALERAGLAMTAAAGSDAREILPGLGLYASSEPLPAPWFESFAFVARSPARTDRIREMLRAHGLSPRSVRVRGQAVDADRWTRELSCASGGTAVVFAYRRGAGVDAIIATLIAHR